MNVYFSDWFDVDPAVLDGYGAFNVSLINDLPLFIDPFLLFTSEKDEYQQLHDDIIKYLTFLRDQSVGRNVDDGLLRSWYMFPEVRQLWLGFSQSGNSGSGLGIDFARSLDSNLHVIFTNFGDEKITKGSHIEKVCLVREGVGRDNISDFTGNLIKEFLLDYTQAFAQSHIEAKHRRTVSVPSVRFDYDKRYWCPKTYDLPHALGDFVLLTPKDILTKDENWINRHDLMERFEKIANSSDDQQLRSQVSQYLERAIGKRSKQEERRRAYDELLRKYPQLIEWYIKYKEDRGGQAKAISSEKVTASEQFYIAQFGKLIDQLEVETDFYKRGIDTFQECKDRIEFLKAEIENNGAYRLFYNKGEPIQRESDLQILFRLTWFATPSDFNSEVNNGRGPVDFKISRGNKDKTLVEFKLAKNSKLKQNLESQVGIYEDANRTKKSLKAIFYGSSGGCVRRADNKLGPAWPSSLTEAIGQEVFLPPRPGKRARRDGRNTSADPPVGGPLPNLFPANDFPGARDSRMSLFYFSSEERQKVQAVLKELKLEKDDTIVLVDCRADNKPSASKA